MIQTETNAVRNNSPIGKASFQEDLKTLAAIELKDPASGANAQAVLSTIKKWGQDYADLIVAFIQEPTAKRALPIYQITEALAEKIHQGCRLNDSEPAFRNQTPSAKTAAEIRAYATPYVGAPLNSMFATFVATPEFARYSEFFEQFRRNTVAEYRPELSQSRLPPKAAKQTPRARAEKS